MFSATLVLTITRPALGLYTPPSWMLVAAIAPELAVVAVVPLEPGHPSFWPPPPAWHAFAVCASPEPATTDPWFFGVDDVKRPALPPAAVATAREMCSVCPVRSDCLEWALQHDERFGIWGGTTGRQRTLMRASLRAGAVTVPKLLALHG